MIQVGLMDRVKTKCATELLENLDGALYEAIPTDNDGHIFQCLKPLKENQNLITNIWFTLFYVTLL